VKFKHPFTCIVAGPTGSGKTSFVIKLMQNLKSLCTESRFVGGIIWCYSEEKAVPSKQLEKLGLNITHQEGLHESYGNARGETSLIILDDLNEAYGRSVCDLFTKGSHHRNISVVLTQNIFHQGTHCRDISLNAKYLVLLKNVRDKNQFTFLARQVYPEHSPRPCKSFRNATERPHGYLILDFAQDRDDMLRFRTNVFPDEGPPALYAPIDDETDRSNYHSLQVLKDARPKLRRVILANSDKELINSAGECALNVLQGNVRLSNCKKRKLRKIRRQIRTVANRHVPLALKKRLIIQSGGFLVPLPSIVLPTIASLVYDYSRAPNMLRKMFHVSPDYISQHPLLHRQLQEAKQKLAGGQNNWLDEITDFTAFASEY